MTINDTIHPNRMKAHRFRFLAWVTSYALSITTASAADWPQWRGLHRDGVSDETIATNWPAGGPRQLWCADVGVGHAPVSIADSRVITLGHTGQNDRVWCLNAVDGHILWQFDYPAIARCSGEPGNGAFDGPHAAPTIDGTNVYTLSRDGKVHCLDLATGAQHWTRDLRVDLKAKLPECGFSSAPLVRNGVVFVNVGKSGTALDASTGVTRWQSGSEMAGYAAPVLDQTDSAQQRLLIFSGNTLFAVNPVDGQTNWSLAWPTSWGVNAVDPMVIYDGIFITTAYNQGCAGLDARTGAVRWKNQNLASSCSPPILFGGNLYGFNGFIDYPPGQAMVCLDPQTGAVRWRQEHMAGQMICVGDQLVLTLVTGELALVRATSRAYSEVVRVRLFAPERCTVPPAFANGRLYCRTGTGRLVCLDLAP